MGPESKVLIAGGGWAGLAAAVELTSNGVPVTLLESSRQLGGRARQTLLGDLVVDNGQHLFIGAYGEILRLLCRMGISEEAIFLREPMKLRLLDGDAAMELRAPHLPAPLHLAYALARAQGFPLWDRIKALAAALRFSFANFEIPADKSVAALLAEHGHPDALIERLWAPICLATLNVGPAQASARVFLRVLRDAFSKRRSDSDLLFQRVPLGEVFPEPARKFIEENGGDLHFSTRVAGLRVEGGKLLGVATENAPVDGTHVILALPPWIAADVLEPWEPTRTLARTLRTLEHTPIATVYLQYETEVRLDDPMVGLFGMTGQWVFDRRHTGQRGLMAVVISGPGPHMAMDKKELGEHVARELNAQFGWPSPCKIDVIREKRATFLCDVGIESKRPGAELPIRGLYLAGDYTATGYPATLEGSVRSGVQCARLILGDIGT